MSTERRARLHAALGDPIRLAIVDELCRSDRSPTELGQRLDVASNLLAHHLDQLEAAGLVRRSPSQGDRRRRYVQIRPEALAELSAPVTIRAQRIVFVCTGNSARSQLAAALWQQSSAVPAVSGGTNPADRINPGAVRVAERAGLSITGTPQPVPRLHRNDLVVTVCDRAHERLEPPPGALVHWSVPDPVLTHRFADTFAVLDQRVQGLAPAVRP